MPKASKSKEGSKIRTDRCFNPLNLSSHPSLNKKESLRSIFEKNLLTLNTPITKESLSILKCSVELQKKFYILHRSINFIKS